MAMTLGSAQADRQNPAAIAELLVFEQAAYHVAVRALRSESGADDVVQQAYIVAITHLRAGTSPQNLRAWFLGVVANAARDHVKMEARRRRREASVPGCRSDSLNTSSADAELVAMLRRAMDGLEEKHRLSVALCCEQDLTQREAAEVLGLPERQISRHVQEGLDMLRVALQRAGYAAAPPAILAGLAHTSPPAPAALTAAVKGIVAGKITGTCSIASVPKGGLVMKIAAGFAFAGIVATAVFVAPKVFAGAPAGTPGAAAGSAALPPAGNNPVNGRQDREEVFEFTQKPTVTKGEGRGAGGEAKYVISFASKGKCDATVAILGPDGKVVRHLASGVLGKNAPWPFKQDSLAQSLEWDGKDDQGKPAPAGCRVKVGLGLQAAYDKSFADFYKFDSKNGFAMTVDKDGLLYVVQNGTIRCFSRDGQYARTLMPPRANVTPETFAGRPWAETAWGERVMIGAAKDPFPNFVAGSHPVGTPVLGPDGRLAVLWNLKSEARTQLHLFEQDGSLPATSSMMLGDDRVGYFSGPYKAHKAETGGGTNHMAVSPDGEWLYVSGAGDAVLRYKWKDLKGPRMPLQIFKGSVDKTGSDNESFLVVSGVACDAEGNVYIADNGNGRIQIYKPDGAYLRTIPVEAPHRIAVHPKTGEIYALCWRSRDINPPKKQVMAKLVKLGKDGQVRASLAVDANWNYWHWPWTAMALDAGAEPPAVWLADKDGIFKVADKGNSFEEVLRLGAGVDKSVYAGASGGHGETMLSRVTVDSAREEVYLGSGEIWMKPWVRIDGRTGKIDPTFKNMKAIEMAMGPDGLVYARVGKYGRFVVRYTREGQPVPFKAGVKVNGVSGEVVPGGDYTAIFLGSGGHSNIWRSGLDVSPSGDIVVQTHEFDSGDFLSALYPAPDRRVPVKDLDMAALAMAGANKDKASANRNGIKSLVEVWDKDGNEKCIAAFEAPWASSGVRMDAQGSIYLVDTYYIPGMNPDDFESFKPGQKAYTQRGAGMFPGSLFKLGWKGGAWPLGRVVKKGENPGLPGMTLVNGGWVLGGVTWAAQDASETFNGGCGCRHSRFGLDRFARSWLPANHLWSVLVYDTNGNRILRVGRYGNADCQGKGSLVPEPDIGFCKVLAVDASDEAMYAIDVGNRRTLRAKLSYTAEETAPVP